MCSKRIMTGFIALFGFMSWNSNFAQFICALMLDPRIVSPSLVDSML